LVSFFFNHSPPTEIYTLSLHDALPILGFGISHGRRGDRGRMSLSNSAIYYLFYPSGSPKTTPVLRTGPTAAAGRHQVANSAAARSEEHTSELQSRGHLVCRLLLEKKKT